MYCRRCGTENAEGITNCTSCGELLQPILAPNQPQSIAPGSVPNYLVWSILATIFCCQIPGIVSIVYAAQVNSKLALGDYAGAVDSSRNARVWAWVAFGLGLVGGLVWLAMTVVGIISGIREG